MTERTGAARQTLWMNGPGVAFRTCLGEYAHVFWLAASRMLGRHALELGRVGGHAFMGR